ncbi:GerAB/ArcD/ProY family transporter [Sporosarcina sp. JAI121]|uniref:GerAB/ArcD/ProY family transporter n=1 Tax=Sporosarcina sp. JAI121 TaxID=2723064 RepID=UPI0015CEF0BA|nr:GerAB/ArcD/ProY family transporter [Sporosarcina sp. JAI121]NYF25471.1 spore germination protein (amino acid permease) [Sporosarcina sp. JAI121]
MDQNQTKVLNGYHVVFLVHLVMSGNILLTLPNLLSPLGFSQWWFPLLFGVIANLLLIPMIWIALKYKQHNLFAIHELLLGKWLGRSLNGFLILYAVLTLASVVEGYLDLIQIIALPDRTIIGPLIVFMLLLVYIVNGDIKSIARFCIISFFLVVWILFFLKWAIGEGDIKHILPLFNFTRQEFFTATKNGFIAMSGFEIILFYFPYIICQKKAFKQASLGIWITVSVYFVTVFASVMYYSEWQLENVMYPVLYLLNAVTLPFLERVDVLAISLWVFLILTTAAAFLWVAKKGLDSIRDKEKKSHLYIIAAIVFGIVSIPFPAEYQKMVYERVYYSNYGFMIWPSFLCIIHLLKTKKEVVK